MFNLKKKIQLKIKIPIKKEESKNIVSPDTTSNKFSISKITDYIYISGYLLAQNIPFLVNNNFTHVINCSKGSSMESLNEDNIYAKSSNIKYFSIYLRDDPGLDIINCFYQIIDFIEKKESQNCNINKKILIHCIEGISRAPALIAGYLMWKNNLRTENAIELIKSKRNCIDINLGFIIQLHKWENYLFSGPQKIQIFRLGENIKLLEDKDFENENLNIKNNNIEYLIRFKNKLYYVYNRNTNEDSKVSEIKNFINNNDLIYNENDNRIKFIDNVIRYDNLLLNNDIRSLIEINFNDIDDKVKSFNNLIEIIENYDNIEF